MPDLFFANHQEILPVDVAWIEEHANQVLPHCLASTGPHAAVLPDLDEVEISLIDDAAIAKVHDEFMAMPDPTDVITFEHGEILISVETARRQGDEFGQSLERELLLYVIHGLLHLNGHHDSNPEEAAAMKLIQESILTEV